MRLPVLTFAIIWAGPALAQPSNDLLPLGLDKLHWQMSADEATKVVMPQLAPPSLGPDGKPAVEQDTYYYGPYHWRDCVFDGLALSFYAGGGLDSINLLFARSPSPASCLGEIQSELTERYGKENAPRGWNTVETIVSLTGQSLALMQQPSHP